MSEIAWRLDELFSFLAPFTLIVCHSKHRTFSRHIYLVNLVSSKIICSFLSWLACRYLRLGSLGLCQSVRMLHWGQKLWDWGSDHLEMSTTLPLVLLALTNPILLLKGRRGQMSNRKGGDTYSGRVLWRTVKKRGQGRSLVVTKIWDLSTWHQP